MEQTILVHNFITDYPTKFEYSIYSPKKDRCAVCGNGECGSHFSASTCRACAAFFRRSVSYKRQYSCINDPVRCVVSDFYGSPPRHMCKLCRFSRCIQNGMNMQYIIDRSIDEFRSYSADSPIRQILIAQRATFINRYAAQLQLCGGNYEMVQMGKQNCVFANKVVIASEFVVLREYLSESGFSDYGFNQLEVAQLAKELFHTWLTFRSTIATLRNCSETNRCYFVDDSFIDVEEKAVNEYVKTCPGLWDYTLAARYALACCEDKVMYAKKLRDIQFDEPELSILFHIFALKTARQLFGYNECLGFVMNQLFEALKSHYTNNYNEIALKMGNMLLMLSELGSWSKSLTEFVTVLTLNGYKAHSSTEENNNLPQDPKV